MSQDNSVPVASLNHAPLYRQFGLPLHVARYRRGSFPVHYHSFLELILVNADIGVNLVGKERYNFRRRQVFRLGTFLPHRIEARLGERCDYFNVTFLPEALGMHGAAGGLLSFYSTEASPPLFLSEEGYRRAVWLCRSIGAEIKTLDRRSPAVAAGLFQALLAVVQRADKTPESSDRRVETVLRILAERFAEPLKTEELAELVETTPSRLAQLFRAGTGTTIKHALRRRRLTEAKRLLAGTDMAVTEILFSCGFNDVSYFNRAFRLDAGVTPREFRRRAKGTESGG